MTGYGIPDGRGPAPLTVRVAAPLLWAAAALCAVWAAASFAAHAELPGALEAAGGPSDGPALWAGIAALSLLSLMAAAMCGGCAVALTRGGTAAHYVSLGTIVAVMLVSAVNLAWKSGGLATAVLKTAALSSGYAADRSWLTAQLAGWYRTYWTVHDIALLAILLVALFLLVLPPSLDHFARRPPPGLRREYGGDGGFGVPGR